MTTVRADKRAARRVLILAAAAFLFSLAAFGCQHFHLFTINYTPAGACAHGTATQPASGPAENGESTADMVKRALE